MTATTPDQQDVFDLIQRWAHTELHGDTDAYRDLFTADFTGVGPVGFVLDGHQWAGRHAGDLHNDAFDVLDPHLRFYGDTVVVEAVQRQTTTARGRDTSGSFRLGLVAVRSDGGSGSTWRIAHLQLSGPLITPGDLPAFAR